jgi:hypothetical protein
MSNPAPRTTESGPDAGWARTVLESACHTIGLDPRGARLIKFTNNAVYNLASEPITVRIAGSAGVQQRVPKIIAVARWLAQHDMPAVRLVDDLPQPLAVHNTEATFWHTVTASAHAPHPDGHDLGRILLRYHTLPEPEFDLPAWNPMPSIRGRLEQQTVLTPDEHQYLTHACDEMEHTLSTVEYSLPPGPIHGDPFIGNLIAGPHEPVICDFDSASHGPREWDLTPVAVGRLRFDYHTDYHHQLVCEYGSDVTTWPHFPSLRRLRELQLVTSVLPVLESNRSLSAQWRRRFDTFKAGDESTRWTTYR